MIKCHVYTHAQCQFILYLPFCNFCVQCVIVFSMQVFLLTPTYFITCSLFHVSVWFLIYYLYFSFILAILWFDLRALWLLSKCSTIWTPLPYFLKII
jgi:hypothetical protein